jgi:hypothetical protein
MNTIKDAINNLIGRKPSGRKVRYAVVEAWSIAETAFMPGIEASLKNRYIDTIVVFDRKFISQQI